jgi:hypothetical protein
MRIEVEPDFVIYPKEPGDPGYGPRSQAFEREMTSLSERNRTGTAQK